MKTTDAYRSSTAYRVSMRKGGSRDVATLYLGEAAQDSRARAQALEALQSDVAGEEEAGPGRSVAPRSGASMRHAAVRAVHSWRAGLTSTSTISPRIGRWMNAASSGFRSARSSTNA
jgi:hypothetical protein